MKKIGFIGIGKLGLDCAEVFAEKYEVRGYDIHPRTSNTVKVCDIEELVQERMDFYCCSYSTCRGV